MADRKRPGWGSPLDQEAVERPFGPMPSSLRHHRFERDGVPMAHRPLGQAPLSECVTDGLDSEPGDLVLDRKGRWCIVWNDAIGDPSARS